MMRIDRRGGSKSVVAALRHSLSKDKTDSTLVQLFRYTFVGGVAFLVDFGALYALTEGAGIHYLVSAALSFCLGLLTNYGLSVAWVFPRRRLGRRWAEFTIFGLIGLVGLGFNELTIWMLTDKLRMHYLMSKIASTVGVYLWNFFARKYTLFRKET
jgi:putative flippase GtrA